MNEIIMLSVRETAKKTGISERVLRQLVKENKISYLRVGKKFLINYEMLRNSLNNGEIKEV